jgi:alpha-galactosidase
MSLPLQDLNLSPSRATRVRDVWRQNSRILQGGILGVQLAAHETSLLRVDGVPASENEVHLAELPARITVLRAGRKPADRGPLRPWVPAQVGYSPDGRAIRYAGERDVNGIGVAPGSYIRVALNREFRRFRTIARTGCGSKTGTGYAIYGDGRLLWADEQEIGVAVDIWVGGVKSLDLVAPSEVQGEEACFIWGRAALER